MTANTLNFVEIENKTAFIDSRVYCSNIIMVDHGDWMSNVLYKHQGTIQQYFGQIIYRTVMEDVATSPPSVFKTERGNVTTKYALLTEAQCNFALTLSRNTPEVVENKARLVADFEKAKQMIQINLERQLQASTEPSDETNETTARLAYFEQRLMETESEIEELSAFLLMMNSFCVHTLGFTADDIETLCFLACYGEGVTDTLVTGLANVKDAKKIQKLAKNISKLLPHFRSAVENATISFINLPE